MGSCSKDFAVLKKFQNEYQSDMLDKIVKSKSTLRDKQGTKDPGDNSDKTAHSTIHVPSSEAG